MDLIGDNAALIREQEEAINSHNKKLQLQKEYVEHNDKILEEQMQEFNRLMEANVEDLNNLNAQGIFKGIERGCNLPEDTLTQIIQKELQFVVTHRAYLPGSINNFLSDRLAHDIQKITNNLQHNQDRIQEPEITL